MKFNIDQIVKDHMATLCDDRTGHRSISDIVAFYVFPIIMGIIAYYNDFSVSSEVYNVSITFFGIFVALLLNLQVAAFGVFQRKWETPKDQENAKCQQEKAATRRKLLSQVNANVSYLILVSCVAIILFLVLFAMRWQHAAGAAIGLSVYCHFVLTILMVVKRSHAIFQGEYKE